MTSQQPTSRLRPFRPVPFGRYTLLLPLSTGGMGEIFLARMEGPQGFEKLCVIKKILPQLAGQPDFVERFVHEAKTLVHLSHGSIAQVLDMGVEDEEPFLALEYVDGKDLRKVAARLRDRGATLPMTVSLHVMSRVLDALAYAHRKRDADEREIRLVHRDISPQNILVSYEGEVKVIDFGLAKSTLTAAFTNPNIVLGKFLYMSPEQAGHQPVDRRSDLYSVGLCLYELLSGKNPFESVPPSELMARVAEPRFAPLERVAPKCPPALVELVTRALAVDVDARFQTAEEFRAKLNTCLHALDPAAGPESVSRFMRETFAVEYHAERRMLAGLRDTLRADEKASSPLAPQSWDETATFDLKGLGFEDPFFQEAKEPKRPPPSEADRATPGPWVQPARSAASSMSPPRPATDLRPTRDHRALQLELRAEAEGGAPAPMSPWLTATDPNVAAYEPTPPPTANDVTPRPAPRPQPDAPTMPFSRVDALPPGMGAPAWRHESARTPVPPPMAAPLRAPPSTVREEPTLTPPPPPRPSTHSLPMVEPRPARGELKLELEPTPQEVTPTGAGAEPEPEHEAEREPEPELNATPDAEETPSPFFGTPTLTHDRSPGRRRRWLGFIALPAVAFLLAGLAYLGSEGETGREDPSSRSKPPVRAPEHKRPEGATRSAIHPALVGPPEDASLLAPLAPAAAAVAVEAESPFPRIGDTHPHREGALLKEWTRAKASFAKTPASRTCNRPTPSPLCVRYSELSLEMREGAGTQSDEQLRVRIRELQRLIDAKTP